MSNNNGRRWLLTIFLVILLSGIAANLVRAQTGNGFDLTWNVAGGGGGVSSGSGFTIQDSIGQNAVGWTSGTKRQDYAGFWSVYYLFNFWLPFLSKT